MDCKSIVAKNFIWALFLFVLVACQASVSYKEELESMAANVNKKCPTMLDSETRIDGVEIQEPLTLVYKYTLVNVLKQNVDTLEFYKAIWPGILGTVKISPEMRKLRENLGTVTYVYNDKMNQKIYQLNVKPDNYQ
jgi:hypothetical protein